MLKKMRLVVIYKKPHPTVIPANRQPLRGPWPRASLWDWVDPRVGDRHRGSPSTRGWQFYSPRKQETDKKKLFHATLYLYVDALCPPFCSRGITRGHLWQNWRKGSGFDPGDGDPCRRDVFADDSRCCITKKTSGNHGRSRKSVVLDHSLRYRWCCLLVFLLPCTEDGPSNRHCCTRPTVRSLCGHSCRALPGGKTDRLSRRWGSTSNGGCHFISTLKR